jgi:hypothetical protein
MFRRFWWVFPVMLPVTAALGVLIAAAATFSLPKLYEGVCVIEVRPLAGDLPFSERETDSHLAEIKSREILQAVVAKLDLTTRWGMDGTQATDTLEQIVTAERIRGTDLISIRVRHTQPVDCRDIALEVANSFGAYLHGIGVSKVEEQLHELSRAVRDQEAKVEELKKVFASLVLPEPLQPGVWDGSYQPSLLEERSQEAKDAFETVNNLEQEKMEHEVRLQSLLRYKDLQLMAYVSGIVLPDNNARTLYEQYFKAVGERKEMERNGLAADDPSVLAADEQVARIMREFDETVVKIRDATEIQLGLVTERLDSFREVSAAAEANERKRKTEAYKIAYRIEKEQDLLQELKFKLIAEGIGPRMPHESVFIHDDPLLPETPVRRNLTFGGIAGILIYPFLALPLMWLLHSRN